MFSLLKFYKVTFLVSYNLKIFKSQLFSFVVLAWTLAKRTKQKSWDFGNNIRVIGNQQWQSVLKGVHVNMKSRKSSEKIFLIWRFCGIFDKLMENSFKEKSLVLTYPLGIGIVTEKHLFFAVKGSCSTVPSSQAIMTSWKSSKALLYSNPPFHSQKKHFCLVYIPFFYLIN